MPYTALKKQRGGYDVCVCVCVCVSMCMNESMGEDYIGRLTSWDNCAAIAWALMNFGWDSI